MATVTPKAKSPNIAAPAQAPVVYEVTAVAPEVTTAEPSRAPCANPKELQRFLDLWAPVVHALPAVINALEREEELTRHVEILEDRRKLALAGAEADVAIKHEQKTTLEGEITALLQGKKAASTALKEHQASCQKRILEAEQEFEAFQANKQVSLQAHQAEVANSIAAIEDTVVMARKKAAEAIASLTEEISLLETKRSAAEQALAAIRANLG